MKMPSFTSSYLKRRIMNDIASNNVVNFVTHIHTNTHMQTPHTHMCTQSHLYISISTTPTYTSYPYKHTHTVKQETKSGGEKPKKKKKKKWKGESLGRGGGGGGADEKVGVQCSQQRDRGDGGRWEGEAFFQITFYRPLNMCFCCTCIWCFKLFCTSASCIKSYQNARVCVCVCAFCFCCCFFSFFLKS